MIYAIASGKGGTGKTTLTASLASMWDRPITAVDLDVEEPNLHLFLHPEITREEAAMMEIPVLNAERCTLCGLCAEFCQFKALSVMGKTLLLFPEMCHGCGGCLALCPEKALTPGERELGQILSGSAGSLGFIMGRLRVGEAMSPPLMRQVKLRLDKNMGNGTGTGNGVGDTADIIIDAPPGVSCPAVNAVMDADCIVLVTEPTPFGLHDFRLAVEAFRPLGKPMGAVINRAGIGDAGVQDYCAASGVPIWAEIPYSREVAEAYSKGQVVCQAVPELGEVFTALMGSMRAAVATAKTKRGEAAHA